MIGPSCISLGTSGLGTQTILALAKHNPRQIVFTGRNAGSAQKVIEQAGANVTSFISCDMNSLQSVKDAAQTFTARWGTADILIANAGINKTGESDKKLSKDGFEPMWGVNHVAHALLVRKLLPEMEAKAKAGADVRIVLLSSLLHSTTPDGGIDYSSTHKFVDYGLGRTDLKRYGQSKLANLLYAQELSKRYPSILTVSLHPGLVMTEMNTSAPWYVRTLMAIFVPFDRLQPDQGAFTTLWAATENRERLVNGEYYEPVGEVGKKSANVTSEKSSKLWAWTEESLANWLQ